jgi:hypothetical protein
MSPNYESLRGETGGMPPDGVHDAYLDRAALVDTRNGEALVTEWRTVSDPLYMWATWFRFEGQGLRFTLDFLDAIGIDRSGLADVSGSRLEDALDARIGLVFAVRTKRWGTDGGGVNVDVIESGNGSDPAADPAQESLDLPHEPVEAEPVGVVGDDDDEIPF